MAMIPRPFQNRLVGRAKDALEQKGNTLAVAPTGAGKTCMMGFLGRELRAAGHGRHLFLQHRQELVGQNLAKYRIINEGVRVSLYTSDAKSMRGEAVFAMAQTLARNLTSIDSFDVLFLDEAHHAAAPTWRKIVDAVLARNPKCMVAGFTATPERGDKKSLRTVFDNVCDQVTLRELIQLGFLVPPKAFVLDVGGTQERLRQLAPGSDWAEQAEVESILNTVAINEEVVRHWRELAGNRCTVVFASTVHHAQDVANAFRQGGITSECVHGGLADAQRQNILRRFARGEIQVLTNCMVLTEGFDHPPVSCVILLRRCSEKGALIQMAGRGLRTVNPEEHPGLVKKDCTLLDFGTSLLTHGDLNMDAMLKEREEREPGDAITKTCPTQANDTYWVPDSTGRVGCGAELPANVKTCPLCGFVFERQDAKDEVTITQVELTEMEILEASPFRYVDLFGSGRAMIAKGFEAWAGIFSPDGDTWHALGKVKEERKVHRIAASERLQAMAAADDFLRTHETDGAAKKTKRWLDEPATSRQVEMLARLGYVIEQDLLGASNFTKYSAACHYEFQLCRAAIERALGVAA